MVLLFHMKLHCQTHVSLEFFLLLLRSYKFLNYFQYGGLLVLCLWCWGLTQVFNILSMCSARAPTKGVTFPSSCVNHSWLNVVKLVMSVCNSVLCLLIPGYYRTLIGKARIFALNFLSCFIKDQLTIFVWVYFCVFFSVL